MLAAATASAAEIVTGAIQDHDRGVVVGERTFGKGLVQEVRPKTSSPAAGAARAARCAHAAPATQVVHLPFRSSLKFTVARYTTPSGRCIQVRRPRDPPPHQRLCLRPWPDRSA